MPDPTPREIALQWIAAYNSHSVEAAVALYDDDVTNVQLPWGRSVQGRDAMRAIYGTVFQAFPDIALAAESVFAEGDRVAVEWRFSGTMRGAFAGHPPTGRSFTLRGCEVLQVVAGKIRSQHGYWDKATMFEQLGLTTNPESTP